MRNRALNDSLFPVILVHPGHGSMAVLKAQTTFMNLTLWDADREKRFDLITNQNLDASGDLTSKPIQASQVIFILSTTS